MSTLGKTHMIIATLKSIACQGCGYETICICGLDIRAM